MTPLPVHLRWMVASDLAAVLEIDRRSYADALTLHGLHRLLSGLESIGKVAEVRGLEQPVVGYAIFRRASRSLVLGRLAVAPEFRRRLVATQLLHGLQSRLNAQRPRLIAVLPDSNLPGHLLLRACGFRGDLFGEGQSGRDQYLFRYHAAEFAPALHYAEAE